MSQQIALSDLIVDLSTDEQQLLAGGQFLDDSGEDGSVSRFPRDGRDDSDVTGSDSIRVYRISSTGIVRIRRLR